jgi:hypothetical protein
MAGEREADAWLTGVRFLFISLYLQEQSTSWQKN